MSRVAKAPVLFPENVEITLTDSEIQVKGQLGTLKQRKHPLVLITKSDESGGQLQFSPAASEPTAWAQSGTMRSLVNNMIIGVTTGFEVKLELVGVGYRAASNGHSLSLSLGFSHPVEYALPEGVTAELPNNTTIVLKSADKQLVGQVGAEIRAYRRPEPYKGKGIKYAGEIINRKETKKK